MIDWPNAARGPAAADGAHTWLARLCGGSGRQLRRVASLAGRRGFLALFLGHLDRDALTADLERVADFRLAHRNLPASEADAIRDLVRRRCSGGQNRP